PTANSSVVPLSGLHTNVGAIPLCSPAIGCHPRHTPFTNRFCCTVPSGAVSAASSVPSPTATIAGVSALPPPVLLGAVQVLPENPVWRSVPSRALNSSSSRLPWGLNTRLAPAPLAPPTGVSPLHCPLLNRLCSNWLSGPTITSSALLAVGLYARLTGRLVVAG